MCPTLVVFQILSSAALASRLCGYLILVGNWHIAVLIHFIQHLKQTKAIFPLSFDSSKGICPKILHKNLIVPALSRPYQSVRQKVTHALNRHKTDKGNKEIHPLILSQSLSTQHDLSSVGSQIANKNHTF